MLKFLIIIDYIILNSNTLFGYHHKVKVRLILLKIGAIQNSRVSASRIEHDYKVRTA
jgi:hypothetical protein